MNNVVKEKNYITNNLKLAGNERINYEDLSQSYLRAETALATQTEIKFQLQKNQVASPLPTEKLLELNDIFVVTHFTVGLKTIASDSPTDNNQQTAIIHNYEDPQVFTGTNRPNVAAIYNGAFNWTINRRVFIPAFSMRGFRRVPDAQTNLQPLAGGTSTTPADTFSPGGLNGYPNGLYGFYPCEPTILDGRQTQDIVIDLGASIAMDDSNVISYAVFEARGYLVTNAKN